jgi:hypothetical protein
MQVLWVEDPLVDATATVGVAATALVRDRLCNRAWPALPVIYTGSQFRVIDYTIPGQPPEKRETFMLDVAKSLVTNWDDPDTLFASPFPTAARDDIHEANGALLPPVDTKVWVLFERCQLPATLMAAPDGSLAHADTTLDDPALAAFLAANYGPAVSWRAVGVRVTAAVPREQDLVIRERLLQAAVAAKVWVVPVFVLDRSPAR